MLVEVGKEYTYLDQWVKVIEINAAQDGTYAECVVESRFGSMSTCDANELGPK